MFGKVVFLSNDRIFLGQRLVFEDQMIGMFWEICFDTLLEHQQRFFSSPIILISLYRAFSESRIQL
jgi:hypothetical protein